MTGYTPGAIGHVIGPCIKRITTATKPTWFAQRNGVGGPEFWRQKQDVRDGRISSALPVFSDYLKRIEFVLSSRATLPHFHQLNWEDPIPIPKALLDTLRSFNLPQLAFNPAAADKDFWLDHRRGLQKWDLRTLNMEIRMDDGSHKTPRVCVSLLRGCSHSL